MSILQRNIDRTFDEICATELKNIQFQLLNEYDKMRFSFFFIVRCSLFHILHFTNVFLSVLCIYNIQYTPYVYLNTFRISSLRVICFDFLPKMRYFTHMRTANALIIAKFNCDGMHRSTTNTIYGTELFSMCDLQVVLVDDSSQTRKKTCSTRIVINGI